MSNYIIRKRNACEATAVKFLKKTVYEQDPDECPDCVDLSNMTVKCKEKDLESYKIALQIFKLLYSSPSRSLQLALWNALTWMGTGSDFDKEDFSEDEYALIMQAIHLKAEMMGIQAEDMNINHPIVTERLILRPVTFDDIDTYNYYYRNDGDMQLYTGTRQTNDKIYATAAENYSPLSYAVEVRATHQLIGNVGLGVDAEKNELKLQYYIFKPFRHNGYCKEALTALFDWFRSHRLYTNVITMRRYVYQKKVVKLDTIRAMIAGTNVASIRAAQSSGMIHEATLSNRMKSDSSWVDQEIYVLKKNQS